MTDGYVYGIVALLPLAALLLVIQTNPYQALVLRGVLGAVAALVYAVVGGADVALTEALVGTMLAITLYAVAVRSSLVMRVGVLASDEVRDNLQWKPMLYYLRALLNRYQLRLELVPYKDQAALDQAMAEREVHATWLLRHPELSAPEASPADAADPPYAITIRVPRLHEIFTTELPPVMAEVRAFAAAPSVPDPDPKASADLTTTLEKLS